MDGSKMSVTNKEDETKTFFWKLESEKVADESEKGQPFHLLDHKFKSVRRLKSCLQYNKTSWQDQYQGIKILNRAK